LVDLTDAGELAVVLSLQGASTVKRVGCPEDVLGVVLRRS
jgi:hypothetical protein